VPRTAAAKPSSRGRASSRAVAEHKIRHIEPVSLRGRFGLGPGPAARTGAPPGRGDVAAAYGGRGGRRSVLEYDYRGDI
jgi:hypothetical protein